MPRRYHWSLLVVVLALAVWVGHPRAQVGSTSIVGSGGTVFYGIGDLAGGGINSIVQEATQVGSTVYAVGASTRTATAPLIPNLDTAVAWDSASNALTIVPDLVVFPNPQPTSTNSVLYAITPNALHIGGRLRSTVTNSGLSIGMRALRVSGGLRTVPGFTALDISDNGNIVFGQQSGGTTTVNNSRAFRSDVSGTSTVTTQVPLLSPAAITPGGPCSTSAPTCLDNLPAFRGMSSDGSVLVGTAFTGGFTDLQNQYQTTNGLAFRWVFNQPAVTEIPRPTGGTWSLAMAVSPDGNLTLASGNSPQFPIGEVWIHNATTNTIQELGSPNTTFVPRMLGGMTADGSVVGVTFTRLPGGQIPGFQSSPTQYAYLHNSHGWFHLGNVLVAQGLDLWANGWSPTDMVVAGIRTVDTDSNGTPDVDLVFGQGRHRNANGSAGNVEGFVVSFPVGVLANYQVPAAAPVANPALIGAWALGADANNPLQVVVFLADGTYYTTTSRGAIGYPDGSGKFETGVYTLTSGNAFTLTTTEDRDGAGPSPTVPLVFSGLVSSLNGRQSLNVNFTSSDTFVVEDPTCSPVCSVFQGTRITGGPRSIVGAWAVTNPPFLTNGRFVAIFLNDSAGSRYFYISDGIADGDNDGENGTYVWDPDLGQITATSISGGVGVDSVALTRDELGLVGDEGGVTFTLTRIVNPSLVRPTITNATLQASGAEDSAFSFTVTATNALTFAASGLPAGLTIDPNTGVISGTPAVNGTFNVTITVTNTFGSTDTRTLVLTFAAPPAGFHGIGDLSGPGGVGSAVRDATRVNGVIYAVGAATVNAAGVAPTVPQLDTTVLWTSTGGPNGTLEALPFATGVTNTNTTARSAFALTSNAGFMASQALSSAAATSPDWVQVTRSLMPNSSAIRNLTFAPGLPATTNLAMSNNTTASDVGTAYYGYGFANVTSGNRVPVRYEIGLGSNAIDLTPTGKNSAVPMPRGTTSDGSVMIGMAATGGPALFGVGPYIKANAVAFRYTHTANTLTGTTSVIPFLSGGTWNMPVAISSTGAQTLVIGDSAQYPNGEVYLTDANNALLGQALGSPNSGLTPRPLGGMTADGVLAVTFASGTGFGPGPIPGLGIPTGGRYAFIHNSHGWFHLASVLAAHGVDLGAQGWDPTNMAVTGVRTVEGVDLVFGQGRRRSVGASGYVTGDVEGFVAELPAGVLAAFNPTPVAPPDPAIVGAWALGVDPSAPTGLLTLGVDGTYALVSSVGFERGLYTWAGNGREFQRTTLYSITGTAGGGSLNGARGRTLTLSGDTLTIADTRCATCASTVATRVAASPGSIVGGWIGGSLAQADNAFVLAVLNNSAGLKYFVLIDDAGGANDSVELGTYTWDPVTHELVATPTGQTADAGNFVTLTRDELGLHLVDDNGPEFDLTRIVAPSLVLPVITSPLVAGGTLTQPFNYTIAASYGQTFGATGLPNGLAVDANTGVISGVPTTLGTANVTISATNTFGSTTTAQLAITVVKAQQAQLSVVAPLTAFYGDQFIATTTGGSGSGGLTFLTTGGCSNVGNTVTMTSGTVDCLVSAVKDGDSIYEPTTSATVTVTAQSVVASVTPNSATKVFGTADPALSGAIIGFRPSDNVTATYVRTPGESVTGSPYTISATLSPSGVLSNYSITYNTATFTISKAATTTTLVSSGSITYGQPVTFTATVAPVSGVGVPTGLVTFKDGTTSLGSASLNVSGVATLTTSMLPSGPRNITADYQGTTDHHPSSGTMTQTVARANTSISLGSSPNPSSPGQTVNFVATVTGQYGGLVTGVVTFKKGQQQLGSASVQPDGTATLPLSTLGTGSTSVTASYAGDANSNASGPSNAVVQNVVAPSAPTTTTLVSSLNPSIVGQSVTLTATVSSATAGVITGTVAFRNGQVVLDTVPVLNGQASYTTNAFLQGTRNLTAVYSGDATYESSTSPGLTQVTNKAATATTLSSSPNPSVGGQLVTLTAVVMPSVPVTPVAGTVTFRRGSTVLGSANVSGGQAVFTTSLLPAGASGLTAIYNGDATYLSSTSATITHTVLVGTTTTTLTATPNPSTFGTAVTFTAEVVSSTGSIPTGTVEFLEGNVLLGTGTLDTSGRTTFTTSTLSLKNGKSTTHNIKARYVGDAYNSGSTSATYAQVINP